MNPDLEPTSSVREAESILEQLAATALDDDYYVTHDKPPGNTAKRRAIARPPRLSVPG